MVLLGGEPVNLKDVSRIVKEKLRENNKLIISVKTHEKTHYKDYVAIIDQLKIADATRISIADTD
jgi:biopolymer transport protein ExbD